MSIQYCAQNVKHGGSCLSSGLGCVYYGLQSNLFLDVINLLLSESNK